MRLDRIQLFVKAVRDRVPMPPFNHVFWHHEGDESNCPGDDDGAHEAIQAQHMVHAFDLDPNIASLIAKLLPCVCRELIVVIGNHGYIFNVDAGIFESTGYSFHSKSHLRQFALHRADCIAHYQAESEALRLAGPAPVRAVLPENPPRSFSRVRRR